MHRVTAIFVLLALLLSLCGCHTTVSDTTFTVRINEVQTSGGEYDWIELYNYGDAAVSLGGCFLTNDLNELGKWQFPAVTLEADTYLILYADQQTQNKDGLHLPFRLNAGGTTLQLSAHNGDILQQLDVPAGASGLSYGTHGDAYAWYASPTPAQSNENGMLLGSEMTVEQYGLRINEYMSRNQSVLYDSYGDYNDWVEIYNFSAQAIDLSGYTLTDTRSGVERWTFPQGIVINASEYLLVHCSGKNTVTEHGEIHTGFKLGNDDSFLGLYTDEGAFCSGIHFEPTEADHSCAYFDGEGYQICRYPTPAYENPAYSTVVKEAAQ